MAYSEKFKIHQTIKLEKKDLMKILGFDAQPSTKTSYLTNSSVQRDSIRSLSRV